MDWLASASWPMASEPQQWREASASIAQVWIPPAETEVAPTRSATARRDRSGAGHAGHGHRRLRIGLHSVAEPAVLVHAPAANLAVDENRTGMRDPGRNGGRARQPGDLGGRQPMTTPIEQVLSPAADRSVAEARAGLPAPGRQGRRSSDSGGLRRISGARGAQHARRNRRRRRAGCVTQRVAITDVHAR
jgi:hypothetical protein